SENNLNLNTIVTELVQAGKIIAVGTDVKYSPKFVDKFCSRLGAKLIVPNEDMKVGYKVRLTENFHHHDDHQRDALAGALHAYHELHPLLKKIELCLKREGKEHLSIDVTLLAIKGMPITEAVRLLEEKKEEMKTKKRIRSKIKKSTAILELNHVLQRENEALRNEILRTQLKLERLSYDEDMRIHEKMKKMIDIKEKKIADAHALSEQQKQEIANLTKKIQQLNQLLFSTKNKNIIKNLKNLGWNEVQKIGHQDSIILVEDVNIFSERSWEELKKHVNTIIFKIHPSKSILNQPFHFINTKDVQCEEYETFAVVDSESIEKEKQKTNILSKIVQEYKEERRVNI
ncbi:MAG: DUF460 domain-containing protein, partial [Nanoarchaeota archaeon]